MTVEGRETGPTDGHRRHAVLIRSAVRTEGPEPAGVALILHGGREHSHGPNPPWRLPAVRMQPFVGALDHRAPDVLAARLRYRYRGWNGDGADALADTVWAIERLGVHHPGLPIVLIGHSMGGRVAVRIAGHPGVRGAVALAPWLPDGEPVEQLHQRALFMLHGTQDTTTSAKATGAYAARARSTAREVVSLRVLRAGHPMLRRARIFQHLAADAAAAIVHGDPIGDLRPGSVGDGSI